MLGALSLGQSDSAEIVRAVQTVADALQLEVRALEEEFNLVRMGKIDQVPSLAGLGIGEALERVSEVAQALAAVGSSVLEGVLRGYASQSNYNTIYSSVQKALRVGREARASGATSGTDGESDAYFIRHLRDLRDLRDAAEELVVVSESGDVPVYEPGEQYAGKATAILVAVGVLTAGGLVWWAVSGG